MQARQAELALGPVLFNWKPGDWRDFYFRIADEAPVAKVCVGESICSKRAPLFESHYEEVADRLARAGKTVVFSTLAQVMLPHDRQVVESICALPDGLIEANDASALSHLAGRAHHVGPFVNVYNEDTLAFLVEKGAHNICLPCELPGRAIAQLCAAAAPLGVGIEVQVFGRMPLALSARCYHARAHGRSRDSCQFVCGEDADGLALETLEGAPFLAVNGIQTLSYDYLNLAAELGELRQMGVGGFRLSPHNCDMVEVASIFCAALDGRMDAQEAEAKLGEIGLPAGYCNGFFHARPGHGRVAEHSPA